MANSSPRGRRRECSTIPASCGLISGSPRAVPPEATALREESRAAPAAPGDTLVALLARNATAHGADIALRERDLGIWREYSWRDYLREVLAFAAGLEALGFAPGEPLMVIGDNRARLYFAMLAASMLRGLPAPIYPEMPAEELGHFGRGGRARFAVAEDQEQVDKLLELRARTGAATHIIYDDPRGIGASDGRGLFAYGDVAERGQARLEVGVAESTLYKNWLSDRFMRWAMTGERRRLAGDTPGACHRLQRALGEALVYGPTKDQLGLSRARRSYTAGEAIGEDTFLFFRALGLDLKQFYGQTENCALTAAQDSANVRLHTVGRALPGVDLRIDASGEILIRADSVFDGYLDDDEATARALEGGWLRSGDAGYLEADGQLVVLGRVGEVVHTRAGERFIPNYIENRIKFSSYIRDVAVLGARRDHLAAIVCIDAEAVGHWAQVHGVSYTSYADLSQKPEVGALVAGRIRPVNELPPPGLKLKRFVNLHKEFDPDDGEVTRTRKLKRNVIERRYAAVIAALYGDGAAVEFEARVIYETGASGMLRRRLAVMEVGA